MTGPGAALGKAAEEGARLSLDQIGYQIAGRKVELVVEDDQADAATALNKTKKLVTSDKVHIIVGPISTLCGIAIQPYVDSMKMPTVNVMNPTDDFT